MAVVAIIFHRQLSQRHTDDWHTGGSGDYHMGIAATERHAGVSFKGKGVNAHDEPNKLLLYLCGPTLACETREGTPGNDRK